MAPMRLLQSLVLLAVLAGCAVSNSPAPPAEAASENGSCTAASSTRIGIRDLTRDAPRWLGRCVTVSGYLERRDIYADVEALYRVPRDPWGEGADGALGVQPPHHSSDAALEAFDKSGMYEITGTLSDCKAAHAYVAQLAANHPDRLVSVGGYCHTSLGLFVAANLVRYLGPSAFERQLPSRASRTFGDLRIAPGTWGLRRRTHELAVDFLSAIRRKDLGMLALWVREADDRDEIASLLMDDPASPFAALDRRRAPQTEIFLSRDDGPVRSAEDATVCYCKLRSCESLWPIRGNDADNSASRPYACFDVSWSTYSAPDGAPTVRIRLSSDGLKEQVKS